MNINILLNLRIYATNIDRIFDIYISGIGGNRLKFGDINTLEQNNVAETALIEATKSIKDWNYK